MSRIFKSIRSNIFVGLVLVTPIVVTAFVVNWLFTLLTNRILILLPKHLREGDHELLWRFVSLLLVAALLFLIGVLARNILGRRIYKFGDRLASRIPLINRVYTGTRQIIASLFQQRKTLFQDAVTLEYPRPGVYSIGFITSVVPKTHKSHFSAAQEEEELVTVFIPTAPNPTSGWICIVPRSATTKLDMTSGEALQFVVSGGAVYPGTTQRAAPVSLVELVHELSQDEPPKPTEPHPPASPSES
ncbi:MAG: DUF502 domain-containing protein [Kiritimatiellae bacterium]|nr:DUF502 domain-containing protein [Kiritimatiellia bacterium]MCO5067114.1 DUF502 domain-containing protein [Kiritimatiellia bacterium]